MNNYFRVGGIIAALTFSGIMAELLPVKSFDAQTVSSILLVTFGIWISISPPKNLIGYGNSEAGTISSIAPSYLVILGFLIISVICLILSLVKIDSSYVWGLMILATGWLGVGISITRGTISYVDKNFGNKDTPIFELQAVHELQILQAIADENFLQDLKDLAEKVSYSSSSIAGFQEDLEKEIIENIKGGLLQAIEKNDAKCFDKELKNLNVLVSNRDSYLRLSRNK